MTDSSGDERAARGESDERDTSSDQSDDGRAPAPEADDGQPSPQEFIEAALFEAHHLANLTGLDEAELARRRLVNAQSATRRTKARDLLADACEYLELAGLERRDAAAGFAKARRYARNAAVELRHESRISSEKSVADLVGADSVRERRTLSELRREATVQSYDRLRREIALEVAFAEIRSQATDGVIDEPNAFDREEPSSDAGDGEPAAGPGEPSGDRAESPLNVEEALRLAALEVDIRRALQDGPTDRTETKFQFLSADQLVSGDSPAEPTGSR